MVIITKNKKLCTTYGKFSKRAMHNGLEHYTVGALDIVASPEARSFLEFIDNVANICYDDYREAETVMFQIGQATYNNPDILRSFVDFRNSASGEYTEANPFLRFVFKTSSLSQEFDYSNFIGAACHDPQALNFGNILDDYHIIVSEIVRSGDYTDANIRSTLIRMVPDLLLPPIDVSDANLVGNLNPHLDANGNAHHSRIYNGGWNDVSDKIGELGLISDNPIFSFFQWLGSFFNVAVDFLLQSGIFTGFISIVRTMIAVWVCKLHLYYKFKILSIFYVVKNKILNNKLLLCFFYILVRFLTLVCFLMVIVSG